MKTILAPIDFSPVSRVVIDQAITLARLLKARVVLSYAVQLPSIVATDLAPLVGETLQFTGEAERGAQRRLQRLQKSLAKRRVTVETICAQGFPTALIVAQAKRLKASYIVIGSHGHTAFYDLVIGSTASGVLKRAPCPVVVVPAQARGKKRPA